MKASGSVLNVLANADISLIGFDKNQVNEEIRKAKFICCQSEWESEITVAESHPFFHGQIDLLLSDDMDLEKFKNRWTIFSKLFDTDGSRIGRDEYLLQRAILTQSEPIKLEGKQSIGFSEKNWPNLLKRNCERMEFRRGMQILIDELIGVKDLGEKLRGMLKFKQAIEAWMNDIILYGDVLFKNSNLKKIQNFWGNGVFLYYKNNSNDLDIFLGANAAFRNRLINYLLKQSELGWRIVPNGRVFLRDEIVFYKGRRIELIRKSENDEGVVFRFEYDKLVVWCKTATDPIVLDVLYPTNGDLDQFITSVELISDNSSNKRLIDFFQRAFIHN